MTDNSSSLLTTSAQRLVEAALQKQTNSKHARICIKHWLLALLERHASMAESMVLGLNAEETGKKLVADLENQDMGAPLDVQQVTNRAYEIAKSRSKLQAAERDLAIVILTAAGYPINMAPQQPPNQVPQGTPANPFEGQPEKSKTPVLDQFGRNLTAASRAGKLSQILGREDETQLMIETLCRRTKRNPVLIGPAGVGKTAVVEGLANLIVSGKVPAMLRGMDIIALQPSTLVAGADTRGELEKRIQAIIKEASNNNILLFIDEIHTIMGAGGMTGTTDMGAQLKPTLARGEIAVIAATTDDEYRKFIETDTALERRFQPIRINELSEEQTFKVLVSLSAELSKRYKISIDDGVLAWLIQFGSQYMRNRHFPDKAVDLLEQSVAHTVAHDGNQLTLENATNVAQRMVGMPLSLEERFKNLEKQVKEQGVLSNEELQALVNRLQVTMRGLDIRSTRPNAVVLLSNQAAEASETVANTLAAALYGDTKRVVTIDLSRMVQPEDVTLLVGAPPGYIGYSDSLPLHRLAQTPWCVVRFENIDLCHPQIRAVVGQAITEGKLTDGRGRPIYFSDTIVLLTASIKFATHRSLGFQMREEHIEAQEVYQAVSDAIGPELADQVDLFLPGVRVMEISKDWLNERLLSGVAERYLKQGVRLAWDNSLIDWLYEQRLQFLNERDWERWIDDTLSPQIIPHLPQTSEKDAVAVKIKIEDNKLVVS